MYSALQRKRGFTVYFGYGMIAFFGSVLALASAFSILINSRIGKVIDQNEKVFALRGQPAAVIQSRIYRKR